MPCRPCNPSRGDWTEIEGAGRIVHVLQAILSITSPSCITQELVGRENIANMDIILILSGQYSLAIFGGIACEYGYYMRDLYSLYMDMYIYDSGNRNESDCEKVVLTMQPSASLIT